MNCLYSVMKSNISVIGAGVAGLASAIRLASRGHSVTVYEKSEVPGGKIGQIQWNGYRWDTGPSLFTLPELMEELYEMAGERMEDSIEYKRLDVITKYFYEDGMQITAYGDPEEFIREVEEKTGESAPRVRRFLRKSETIYNLTKDVFIFGVFNSIKTFISRSFIKAALQIHKLDVFSSMHRAIEKRIRSGHLVQLFDRYATYNGSNPFRAPATLNVISHLEHNLGAYFPEKGMRALADELYRLAVRSGVTFHFNSPVEAIHMDRNTVNGIQVKGKFVSSDIVISDIDI